MARCFTKPEDFSGRDFYLDTDTGGDDIIRSKPDVIVNDETGSNAPIAPSAPTNPPADIADKGILVEHWDDYIRYWEYDANTPAWTVIIDSSGGGGGTSVNTDATLTGDGTPGTPLSVVKTGDWTGTFDGQEGTYYLDYTNFTNTPIIPTVSDTPFDGTWNGDLDGASKNAIFDKISSLSSSDITDFTEVSQDIAGGMFSGNTETRIAATYDDALGKINLTVEANLSSYNNDPGFISNIVEDPTPQLGGDLDAQNNEVTNIDGLSFNLTPVTTGGSGQIWWNPDEETFNMGVNGDITLQVGQEMLVYYRADENISKGQVIMYTGSLGASGKPTGALSTGSEPVVMGIATENVTTGNFAFLTWFGKVRGIQTNGANYGEVWSDGDTLYNNPAVSGGLTNVQPTAPNHAVVVAYVIEAHATTGTLFVAIDQGAHLDGLHDVDTSGKTAGDVIVWDSISNTWVSQKVCDANLCADLSSYTGLDGRYYTESELDAGQLDNRYYTESEVDALTWDASDITTGTFADALVAQSNVTQHVGAIDHDSLLNYDIAEHRVINDAGTLTTELWSASKINTELSVKSDTGHTHTTSDITDLASYTGLDARYYTETELDAGQLDNRYYTETELNAGQLDNRYFTESEHINTSAGVADAGKPIVLDASGVIDSSMYTAGVTDHGALTGLTDDDHSQYALLDGRASGQTLIGGTAASETLVLRSTSNATKGTVDIEGAQLQDANDPTKEVALNLTAITTATTRTWTIPDRNLDFSSGGTFAENSHVHDATDVTTGTFADARIAQSNVTQHQGAIDHGSIAGLADDDHTQYHNDTRGDARYYTKTLLDAGQLDTRYYTETEIDTALGGYTPSPTTNGPIATSTYTLLEEDAWDYIPFTAAGGCNITIPPNSSVDFPVGQMIMVAQHGAGAINILAGSGVTILTSAISSNKQYDVLVLYQVSTDTWNVIGGV